MFKIKIQKLTILEPVWTLIWYQSKSSKLTLRQWLAQADTLHSIINLSNTGLRIVSQQGVHCHHKTRSAETTLWSMSPTYKASQLLHGQLICLSLITASQTIPSTSLTWPNALALHAAASNFPHLLQLSQLYRTLNTMVSNMHSRCSACNAPYWSCKKTTGSQVSWYDPNIKRMDNF